MFGTELHDQRARDFESDARTSAVTAPIRRARRLERLARVLGAGAAWTDRRARGYACRARSLRTARTAL
jgi:hypothetical protein